MLLLVSVVALAAVPAAAAGPKAKLWERWTAHDPASTATIDHAAWQGLLQRYVRPYSDGINRVAYGSVTAADRRVLEQYIARLAALPISTYNRKEQRAYWINLYNALTVKIILDHYPIKSIRKIKPGLFSIGPWGQKLVTVEGQQLSLDDIEHRILRPIWRDPRIHYAVNCAAISCPSLQEEAFTGSNVDALLTHAALAYINIPYGVQINNGRLVVSSLYRWYKEDFGGNDEGVIRHLRQYARPPLAASLRDIKKISNDRYDWGLNDLVSAP
ncbi:MAG: DUF547 domain-containing protein [Acidiferrobacterales bacterium]